MNVLLIFLFSLPLIARSNDLQIVIDTLVRPEQLSSNKGLVNNCNSNDLDKNGFEFYKQDISHLFKIADAELKGAEEVNEESMNRIKKNVKDSNCEKLRDSSDQYQKYVDRIVDKLVTSSNLKNRLKSEYGVCIVADTLDTGAGNLAMSPKGTIFVPGGYLLGIGSEAEFSFGLAHELAHFLLHHNQRLTHTKDTILGSPYGFNKSVKYDHSATLRYRQIQEKEADELAINLLLNAGYSYKKGTKVLNHVAREGGGEHPSRKARKRAVRSSYEEFKDSRGFNRLEKENGKVKYFKPIIGNNKGKIPKDLRKHILKEIKSNGGKNKIVKALWWK
jgi:hypothetical protein